MDEPLVVQDPVHGTMKLSSFVGRLARTPAAMRTRHVHQLGTAFLHRPGASHSRMDHMLGTAFLARRLVSNLVRRYTGISPRDALLAEVAGFCHDWGHGPFSHVFETVVSEVYKCEDGRKWTHERQTIRLIDWTRKHFPDACTFLRDDEWSAVKAMIRGDASALRPERAYLAHIISNSRCGVDVDRLDYLARDAHMLKDGTLGLPPATVQLVLESARLAWTDVDEEEEPVATPFGGGGGRIERAPVASALEKIPEHRPRKELALAFPFGVRDVIRTVFQARSSLHIRLCKNTVEKSLSDMLVDMFRTSEVLQAMVRGAMTSEAAFLRLTDAVLWDTAAAGFPDTSSGTTELGSSESRSHMQRRRECTAARIANRILAVDVPVVLGVITSSRLTTAGIESELHRVPFISFHVVTLSRGVPTASSVDPIALVPWTPPEFKSMRLPISPGEALPEDKVRGAVRTDLDAPSRKASTEIFVTFDTRRATRVDVASRHGAVVSKTLSTRVDDARKAVADIVARFKSTSWFPSAAQ